MQTQAITVLATLAVLAILYAAARYFKARPKIDAAISVAEEDVLTVAAKGIETGMTVLQKAHAGKLRQAAALQAEAADIAKLHEKTRTAIAALAPLS